MIWAIGIPFLLGMLGILQGAINRMISIQIGNTIQVVITCAVAMVLSVVLYAIAKIYPSSIPDFLQLSPEFKFKWYYLIPGAFGFFIITTIPVSIEKFGALKVTVGIVAAQMITSVLWDMFVEKIPLTSLKIMGIVLGALSTVCIVWEKQ